MAIGLRARWTVRINSIRNQSSVEGTLLSNGFTQEEIDNKLQLLPSNILYTKDKIEADTLKNLLIENNDSQTFVTRLLIDANNL